jgi:hypothetical protein
MGVAQVVEHLSSQRKVLSSKYSTTTKNRIIYF